MRCKARKVEQLDYETGELIAQYANATEAADHHGIIVTNMHTLLRKGGRMRNRRLAFRYKQESYESR